MGKTAEEALSAGCKKGATVNRRDSIGIDNKPPAAPRPRRLALHLVIRSMGQDHPMPCQRMRRCFLIWLFALVGMSVAFSTGTHFAMDLSKGPGKVKIHQASVMIKVL